MELLFLAALLGLLPASIAQRKDYSFLGWWIFGALLLIVALPYTLLMKPNESTCRLCPSCRRSIGRQASVCPQRGRDVPEPSRWRRRLSAGRGRESGRSARAVVACCGYRQEREARRYGLQSEGAVDGVSTRQEQTMTTLLGTFRVSALGRRALLRGAAGAFDLRGNTRRQYVLGSDPEIADARAIGDDWAAVGGDLRVALDAAARHRLAR
jgi:hypothetical protein